MTDKKKTRAISIKARKKAQPDAKLYFSQAERDTIINTVAKNLNVGQTGIFFYQCQALGLNPLLSEICAVVYKGRDGNQMSIQVMRDGFLKIAHRSGKFNGMESGVKLNEKKELVGWARVYHKDFKVPLYQEADMAEYTSKKNALWGTKPRTMIKKVAESMALRKAFNVSGVYAPEEMDEVTPTDKVKETPKLVDGDKPATGSQLATIKTLGGLKRIYENKTGDNSLTKQEATDYIKELMDKKGEKCQT